MTSRRESDRVKRTRLCLDFSNMMSDFTGKARGITRREIDELAPRAQAIAAEVEARRRTGAIGFFQLPYDIDTASAVMKLADNFKGKYDDFVVLGIGGSALGATALFCALFHPQHNLLPKSKRS